MIPAHTNDGFLPEGIHYATWAEFTERFGTTARRVALIARAHEALVHLAEAGCAAVLVGGSFVTTKDAPEDLDLLWAPEGVDPDALHPAFLDMSARPALKARFGVDIFPAIFVEAASGLPFAEFFQRRKYDITLRCGAVHLDLNTL